MNLRFSHHFLFAGLFLTVSALTDEECRPLLTPQSLANPSMTHGRVNVFIGYSDSDVFKALMKAFDSTWINITQSPFNPSDVLMYEYNKINGSCFVTEFNLTMEAKTATVVFGSITSVFQLLPSCEGCMVLFTNSTIRSLDKFLTALHVNITINEPINARSLYLMGRESTLKDSDLEHFKQQASCLGFSGEPEFRHDPKQEFCKKDESAPMSF